MRAWYMGCATAFQAVEPGSSPGARTNKQAHTRGKCPTKGGNMDDLKCWRCWLLSIAAGACLLGIMLCAYNAGLSH